MTKKMLINYHKKFLMIVSFYQQAKVQQNYQLNFLVYYKVYSLKNQQKGIMKIISGKK